jgi:hypothetical protein
MRLVTLQAALAALLWCCSAPAPTAPTEAAGGSGGSAAYEPAAPSADGGTGEEAVAGSGGESGMTSGAPDPEVCVATGTITKCAGCGITAHRCDNTRRSYWQATDGSTFACAGYVECGAGLASASAWATGCCGQ